MFIMWVVCLKDLLMQLKLEITQMRPHQFVLVLLQHQAKKIQKEVNNLKLVLRKDEKKKQNYLILLVLQLQNSVEVLVVFLLTHLDLRLQEALLQLVQVVVAVTKWKHKIPFIDRPLQVTPLQDQRLVVRLLVQFK